MLQKIRTKIKTLSRAKIVWSSIFLAALIIALSLYGICNAIIGKMYDQQAAKRWGQDQQAYQITILFDKAAKVSDNDIKRFEYDYNKLLSSTFGDAGQEYINMNNEDSSYYAHSYMAEGRLNLSQENKSVNNAKVYGVSGNYELFHPFEMISGSFLKETEAHPDCVVIDEFTAYSLFGSTNVVGLPIYVQNTPLYVAGVYKSGTSEIVEAANGWSTMANTVTKEDGSVDQTGKNSLIYMSYDTMCSLCGETKPITCFEFVSIAPSEKFLYDELVKGFTNYMSSMEIVKNSSRFGIENMYRVLRQFGIRSMHVNNIDYPYFENIARAREDLISHLYLYIFVLLLLDLVLAVIFLHHLWVSRTIHISVIRDRFSDFLEKIREKKNEQKRKWEHF